MKRNIKEKEKNEMLSLISEGRRVGGAWVEVLHNICWIMSHTFSRDLSPTFQRCVLYTMQIMYVNELSIN